MTRFQKKTSFHLKWIPIFAFLLTLLGSERPSESPEASKTKALSHTAQKILSSHRQVWSRIQGNPNLQAPKRHADGHQHVQKHVKQYTASVDRVRKIGIEATPYLYYIVEQLEKRNMPIELALLPMVESAFQPQATSQQGATGLWQFIASTGKSYGLKQDAWYDGRRDIKASTKAALDYLSFLHETFDQNWMLALAAYNAGEGTVQRAIKRNQRAGKPTTFWDLPLPKETREYVPKFLALTKIIKNPDEHGVSLPHIANKPYFTQVNPGSPLNFRQAAKLADIDVREIKQLNPGYRQASTHPNGPQGILLPVASVEKFRHNLAKKR